MKDVLKKLQEAKDILCCYKNDPGIKGHSAYYLVDKSITILEEEKFVFPNEKDSGMTLRDYFAGQALAGYMAWTPECGIYEPEHTASECYLFADAMLKAREKVKEAE